MVKRQHAHMGMTRFIIDPERSTVSITGSSSVHPIHATAAGLQGWCEINTTKSGVGAKPSVSGEVRIAVDLLKSGNSLVDAETRRRIDARRYPEIVGRVTSSERLDGNRLGLTGEIEFKGEVVGVSGELEVEFHDGELILTGAQRFDVRDWGLQPPKIALLRVHPEVEVEFRAHAR